jgi:hypothetical protein
VDRRNFLKASTLTAGATLLPNVFAQTHTAQGQDLRMLPMNRGWRFSPKVVEGDTSVDGSASNDGANQLAEGRQAMLLQRVLRCARGRAA